MKLKSSRSLTGKTVTIWNRLTNRTGTATTLTVIKKKNDEILSLRTFHVEVEGELYALGWYGVCNWLGSLSEYEDQGDGMLCRNI